MFSNISIEKTDKNFLEEISPIEIWIMSTACGEIIGSKNDKI